MQNIKLKSYVGDDGILHLDVPTDIKNAELEVSCLNPQRIRQRRLEILKTIAPEIAKQWKAIAPILTIRTAEEYEQGIELLNALLDEVGTNEEHPLYSLLDTLGIIIEAYEEENYQIPDCSGVDLLCYFMQENSLSQSDLPEIGSQAVVSEVIDGKRELNIKQIRALAKRFNVSPSVFL